MRTLESRCQIGHDLPDEYRFSLYLELGRCIGRSKGHLQSIKIAALHEPDPEGPVKEAVVPPSAYSQSILGKFLAES